MGESSLLKLATSVVGAVASIVSIAGAVVGLATTQNLVIALGVAGLVYASVLAVFYIRLGFRQEEDWKIYLAGAVAGICFLIILEAIFGKFIPTWTTTYAHFERFGLLQVLGIIGLLLLGYICVEWARAAYKESKEVKDCPDCGEKCKEKAHVCRWCGFRWAACPEKTFVPATRRWRSLAPRSDSNRDLKRRR